MYEGRGWMLTVSSQRQLTVEKGGNVVAEGRSREVDERNSVHLGVDGVGVKVARRR